MCEIFRFFFQISQTFEILEYFLYLWRENLDNLENFENFWKKLQKELKFKKNYNFLKIWEIIQKNSNI